MSYYNSRFKGYILKNYIYIFYFLSLIIPFTVFLKTMNPSSFGWDTTWLHIQVPLLYVGQTTGFPIAFLTGKLFSFLPVGTMAYRLNMYSVFWGALTVFILFLFIKNILKNEYYTAFISAVFFGFFRVFWFQTSRFEVYTLNTFFTAIIMLTGFYWVKTKKNKFLYLYYFLIGLSFTNHPISLFLSPAFIFFPVYSDWKQVFKIKKIFIILTLIISPNLLYLYIPIRSLQGFGNVTSFGRFISYISGDRWRGDFGFKGWEMLKHMFTEYLNLIKEDFNIAVLVIFIIGLVYLALKQKKYFILIISLIVLNFIPILLYEKQATHFYLTTMVVFLSVPFACGLYWIKEGVALFFNKYLKKLISKKIKFLNYGNVNNEDEKNGKISDKIYRKKFIFFRSIFLFLFFLTVTAFPLNLFALNYKDMDFSKSTYVYDYWLSIINKMNADSIILTNSLTSHVPIYIDRFETKKNINVIRNVNLEDIKNTVKENIDKNDVYYSTAYLPDLSKFYDVVQVGERFVQEGFDESFMIFKINDIKVDVEITTDSETLELEFGKKSKISFYIKNNSSHVLQMSSIELRLPKIIKFLEIDSDSDMKAAPGIAQGAYMWTAGPYTVQPGDVYVLSFFVQSHMKAEGEIEFRITTAYMFVDGPVIKVFIK